MKGMTLAKADNPANIAKLSEIQEQMRDMCQPHYDEFYKVTTERGFVKITIPKKRP